MQCLNFLTLVSDSLSSNSPQSSVRHANTYLCLVGFHHDCIQSRHRRRQARRSQPTDSASYSDTSRRRFHMFVVTQNCITLYVPCRHLYVPRRHRIVLRWNCGTACMSSGVYCTDGPFSIVTWSQQHHTTGRMFIFNACLSLQNSNIGCLLHSIWHTVSGSLSRRSMIIQGSTCLTQSKHSRSTL